MSGDNLFGAAFMALPDAVCILEPVGEWERADRNWKFVAANPALQQLLGLSDVTGRSLRDIYREAAGRWFADFERVLASGVAETLVRAGLHQQKIFEITLAPLQCGEGGAIMARVRDITSEHLARVRRREADARYKTLFDAIDEGFCIVQVLFDPQQQPIDYLFIEANGAFVAHTGMKDPVGKRVRQLQPDIEDHWQATYGRIALSGVAERFESESLAMGRWFDVFAFPIGEHAPYLVGILFEDVGERKSMELALRRSERRLHSLIEATSDLIFRMNPEGTLMEQVGGKGLLGNVGEAGNWITQFVPEADRAQVQQSLDAAIWRREPLEFEHRVQTPGGRLGWLYTRAVPVLNDSGAITEWFGMATDITARHRAEQQLAHGAQMLRVAGEIGKVGLWDWNVETDEVTWSDEHFRMEGYTPGEVVPSYELWAERIHPDDRSDAEASVVQAMETGEEYINEYRVCHPDGDIRWLSSRGRFLFDEKARPVRMLGAMVDTTERRRQEEWQKLLVAELQHRVRNLIGMVRSVARLSAPGHRHVDEYVDHLIGRLQAMGRTQSTLTRSPGRSVDLSELVREELLVHAPRPEQTFVEGPVVALSPHASEIVTLAIHELATNSIKYGALGDTGYVRITWITELRNGTNWVSLTWQETSPPQKTKRERKGFGRRLIEERVPYELQGVGRFHVHDTGMIALLEFPLTDAPSILETRS